MPTRRRRTNVRRTNVRTISATELQRNTKELLAEVRAQPDLTLTVTHYRQPHAVMISIAEHDRLREAAGTLGDIESGARVIVSRADAETIARMRSGEPPMHTAGS